MSRLPEFDRALTVASPSGDAIAAGSKTAVVKTWRYFIENETILIVQDHRAIGTIRLMARRPSRSRTFAGRGPATR
jgi:hypothetical protein